MCKWPFSAFDTPFASFNNWYSDLLFFLFDGSKDHWEKALVGFSVSVLDAKISAPG